MATTRRSRFGNTRKLPSGRWQARFKEGGVPKSPEPGVTYETKKEAQDALADYESDRRRGRLPQAPLDEPLTTWAWRWFESHCAESPPSTRTDYRSIITFGILRPGGPLTNVTVREITPIMIRAWLRFLSEPWVDASTGKPHVGYGPARRSKAFRILSRCLKDARANRLLDENPCDGIVPITKTDKTAATRQHYYLYVAETCRIIAAADHIPQKAHEDWGLYFETLAWTGMRPQEVRALWPEQINARNKFILVDAAISDGATKADMVRQGTKPGYERTAYLPTPVLEKLLARVEARRLHPQQLIFPAFDPNSFMWPSTYREQGWLPMLGVAGVGPEPGSFLRGRRQQPIPYDLRAFMVSHLRSAGVPHIDVGAQVGHQDQETSGLYTVVHQAGMEDPIAVAARKETDQTRAGVIEYLYAQGQATLG